VLDNPDYIKSKIEMLDNLLEIEVAYSLLKSGSDEAGEDPIDAHYKKLNCSIGVLDKSSSEFGVIEKYVHNTHATTHNLYSLELLDVFKIDRKGESSRSVDIFNLSLYHIIYGPIFMQFT
jgi:poly [ADP-ribose] polymerase